MDTVVDASVVMDFVLGKGFAAQARQLVTSFPSRRLIAPSHLQFEVTNFEVTNALHRRTLRTGETRITRERADAALTDVLSLVIVYVDPPGMFVRALELARSAGLPTTYDATYVALAQLQGGELWTGDRQLVNTVAGDAPRVRFSGDFPGRDGQPRRRPGRFGRRGQSAGRMF